MPEEIQPRFGFCCKYMPPASGDAKADLVQAQAMNVTTTTVAALTRLVETKGPSAGQDKINALVQHNLAALRRQVAYVAGRPVVERLHRIQSDLLPLYTHPSAMPFYADAVLRTLIEVELAEIGEAARAAGVRLSMHPGQYCVVASQNPNALANGVRELMYHIAVMEQLGYGSGWHPHGAHVNIHGGARAVGVDGLRAGIAALPESARNLMTLENDEVSYGVDSLLELADMVPVVLDLHHHWIASRGEYMEPEDPRVARVIESWRGTRPLAHISVSREDLLVGHDPLALPSFDSLISGGATGMALRAHSDMMWNGAVNDLVARHLRWADFEVEAKFKNLASAQLASHYTAWLAAAAPTVVA